MDFDVCSLTQNQGSDTGFSIDFCTEFLHKKISANLLYGMDTEDGWALDKGKSL